MKSFAVVFAFCLVGAFAAGIPDEHKEKHREYKVACIAETGVDEAVIENIKSGKEVVFDEKLNCFSACFLKKTGIINPDGVLDEEVTRAKLSKNLSQEKVDQVINSCKAQVGKDSCETGGKILECYLKSKALFALQ